MKTCNKALAGQALCLALCVFSHCASAEEVYAFQTPQQASTYQALVKEIRCITCPNQNIAESEGGLAQAIKTELVERITQGESAEAIRISLQERYGDQILYRPPLSPRNWILWWGPLALCLMGLSYWWFSVRVHDH